MFNKLSEKLRAKFPAITPGCSMLKFARLDDAFLEVFYPQANQWKVNHCSKKKRKGEKSKAKKIPKIEKPKDLGRYLKILMPESQCGKTRVVAREASCCVADAFSTGSKLFWPRSSLIKSTKMSKKRIFCKKFQESMVKVQVCKEIAFSELNLLCFAYYSSRLSSCYC